MPTELSGDNNMERHEIGGGDKPIEGDYDTHFMELENCKLAAEELDTAEMPVVELEGDTLVANPTKFENVPVITVDSPK
jgi:hypothetical protein